MRSKKRISLAGSKKADLPRKAAYYSWHAALQLAVLALVTGRSADACHAEVLLDGGTAISADVQITDSLCSPTPSVEL